jgi:hypothetical protein
VNKYTHLLLRVYPYPLLSIYISKQGRKRNSKAEKKKEGEGQGYRDRMSRVNNTKKNF